MIPLSSPDITELETAAVVEVLHSAQLSLGPKLEEFEQRFADYVGCAHAVAVSSGTAGLHLCIRALGITSGDEVIVPSFTFIAAANAIRYEDASPVFVDIDPHTLNLSPAAVEAAITPRTRAILVVHNFGVPADMALLQEIADRHHLLLIEDACEAIGAEYRGRRVGSLGVAGVFAFYPNKQITTGEGGMIVTGDAQLAARMRALRNQGRYGGTDWLQHAELGFNYRLPEINCALGLVQLSRIDAILTRREEVAREYHRQLSDIAEIIPPPLAFHGSRLSWFVFVVRLQLHLSPCLRETLIEDLQAAHIGCGRYFAPLHLQPAYAAWREGVHLPVTEAVGVRTLALPFFNRLTVEQIQRVCSVLRSSLTRRLQ